MSSGVKLRLREYDKTTGALLGYQTRLDPVGNAGPWSEYRVMWTPIAPGRSTLDLTAYQPGSEYGCSGFRFDDVEVRHTPSAR